MHRFKNKKIFIFLILINLLINFFTIFGSAAEGRPDLIIDSVNYPVNVSEGKNVEFIVKIKNIKNEQTGEYGNISSGTNIYVSLKIDNIIVKTNSANGLKVGESKYVNLSWTAKFGSQTKHSVSIEVDYNNNIFESNENNNYWDGFIYVSEKGTELKINKLVLPNEYIIGIKSQISLEIINNGAATTGSIFIYFNSSISGVIEYKTLTSILDKDEIYTLFFNWTPAKFGTQKIKFDIIYNKKTHDIKEKSITVGVENLLWWNSNWHYRMLLSVNGTGNVLKFLNFTQLLDNLGVNSQVFENNTIRIVEYSNDGKIVKTITTYKFNESTGFNNVTNAVGNLIWTASGISGEKYYMIYFDVKDNKGTRTEQNETQNLIASGTPYITPFTYFGGWSINFNEPVNNSYSILSQKINIKVSTIAKAKNVNAYIFLKDNQSHSFTINLNDIKDNISWSYSNFEFDKKGTWIIRISSEDWAGFSPKSVDHEYNVGLADLKNIDVVISTNNKAASPKVYIGDIVNFTVELISYNATIQNVKVFMQLFDDNNTEIYNESAYTTINKDKKSYKSFYWDADYTGFYNVTIKIDPDNLIEETDETNNNKTKAFAVYSWPDLVIKNIYFPYTSTIEFEKVKFDITVSNIGLGDCENYILALYLEKIETKGMFYKNKIVDTTISLKRNTSKTYSLVWNSSQPGEWYVGANIIVPDYKSDTNRSNNRMLADYTLKIKGIERNKPVISNITTSPIDKEQGSIVTISAKITDDTGLSSVKIQIIAPDEKSYNGSMIRTNGSIFEKEFFETSLIGNYLIKITASDLTVYENTATINDSFEINKDSTLPVISYFDVKPSVQLLNKEIEISCIASDNIGIKTVRAVVIPVSGESYTKELIKSNGKYVFTGGIKEYGKHDFYIEVIDFAGNNEMSEYSKFWITKDINDTDNDGMPDWYENKYDFNPQDPKDGEFDDDDDGYTNSKEYSIGTNPLVDILYENVGYRIESNVGYIIGSIVCFMIILFIYFILKRRY